MREHIRATIGGRKFSEKMKRALCRLLDGESYRIAATCEHVGFRELHRNAATIPGLQTAHLIAWRDDWGTDFPPTWRQHLRDLDEAG